ncbi:MM3350-like domain-containing protein [Hypoxylon sp. NC1633]|nr:MM3350-like domain-containing protein [Hypoxylon sp. NC1633]
MATQASPKKCGNPICDKTPESTALKQCSRCKTTSYCSQECQALSWPTHKMFCRRQNYIIKFHLMPDKITNPPVFRTISCPANALFYHLHMALQVAFGWATTHSFDFAIANPDFKPPTNRMEYMMWNRPGAATDPSRQQEYFFRVTDPTKQTPYSGIDRVHEDLRRHPRCVERLADKYRLYQLFDNPKYQGQQMIYTYDFGDNWEHHATFLGRTPATSDFSCLDGSGHGVAEDVGSAQGWTSLKAAYRAARPSNEQSMRRTWFERLCANPDPLGLAGDRVLVWDRDAVNATLVFDTMFARFERMADEADARVKMYEEENRRR